MNVRLLQLASPSLPVGAYSYSQGLEAAVEGGVVHDVASAERWIGDVLELSMASMEAPILARLIDAWQCEDTPAARRWNAEMIVSRETAELRGETVQMGYSLLRLLRDLRVDCAALEGFEEVAYPTAFAAACAAWSLDRSEAIATYVFAWIENQVLAAVKCVPLGQTDGQRLMLALAERISAIVARAIAMEDHELANFAPGLAILSSRHETQYSRIFRS
jgi:urease accessory protein